MPFSKILMVSLALISITMALSQPVLAKNVKHFGKDNPFLTRDLPPGQLRKSLEDLPAPARERAIKWLNRFEFTELDLSALRVDQSGGVFYEDPVPANAGSEASTSTVPLLEELTISEVFKLHSKPSASRTVHLDMDGRTVTGTAWNNNNADPLYMKAYSIDSDPTTFSQTELNAIAETWKRIAEDFAPFNIDVTTEEPANYGPNVGVILVTPKADENGNEIYTCGCGGVAYVNVWGNSNFTSYQPALVFTDGVGTTPHNITEAASHELGHNLGLSHDATSTVGYYDGHGTGNTSWAPIMGVGYYSNVTQWSQGEYQDASQFQDDLQIIADKLFYRSDDHEDIDLNSASPLNIIGTAVSASNQVNDPSNHNPDNKGVIEDQADIDLFYFEVGAGVVDLTITPAWVDYYWLRANTANQLRGANVDIKATLLDEFGSEISASNPLDDTYAHINTNVDGGRYILAIEGVGAGNPLDTGYTDYGSLGQYFINGTVPDNVITTAPPPTPTGLSAVLNGVNNIDLSWTDPAATAENNENVYHILRQDNGGSYAEITSIAANSTSYSDNNLVSGAFSYQVEASNSQGSSASNITTPIEVFVPAVPTLALVSSESSTSGSIQIGSYFSTTILSDYEELIEQHQGGKPQNRISQLIHSWNVTGVAAGASVVLDVTALAPSNSENDDFDFFYSINGGSYVKFGTLLNGTGSQTMSVTLPSDTVGSVSVRVNDTDRTRGRGQRNTLQVSYIVVTSSGDAGDTPPLVTISTPSSEESFAVNTPILFSASAADDNDGDVSASIQWFSNLDAALGAGANLSRSDLSVGTHLITAEAQDSIPSTGSDSISISIDAPLGNSPPEVTITSPGNNSSFEQNQSVSFTGTASDTEDGDLSNSLSWTSNLDGALGSNASISSSSLSTGAHSITARVTDSAGSSDSDSINITITAPPGSIALQVAATKVKGQHTPRLTWNGASGSSVDVYRDSDMIVTTANNGTYSDSTGNKGGRTYFYQVCEAETDNCSAEVSVLY